MYDSDAGKAMTHHGPAGLYDPAAIREAFPQFLDFRRIAASENGSVWSAWDPNESSRVALKLIRDSGQCSDIRERFEREYDILRSNPHDCLVRVFPSKGKVRLRLHNKELDHYWFTMELCHSDVKTSLITLSLEARLTIIDQFLQGLCYLHTQDIAHRDIKPQNLFLVHPPEDPRPDLHTAPTMLKRAGDLLAIRVKIGDFGIAKDARAPSAMMTLMVIGTDPYLAPERFVVDPHRSQDWRPSDQYAAGVTLYEILSRGEHPLDLSAKSSGRDPREEYRRAHERGQLLPLRIPERRRRGGFEIFPEIERVIARMMAPEPRARYPHIRECLPELRLAINQSGL